MFNSSPGSSVYVFVYMFTPRYFLMCDYLITTKYGLAYQPLFP